MKKSDLSKGQGRWFNIVAIAPGGMFFSALLLRIAEEYWAFSYHGREVFAVAFFIATITAGFFLWYLREIGRAFYGSLELIFALVFMYFTIFIQLPPKPAGTPPRSH